jgi:hypothetical protein
MKFAADALGARSKAMITVRETESGAGMNFISILPKPTLELCRAVDFEAPETGAFLFEFR